MGGAGHTHDFAWMREEKNLEVVNIDCRMNDTVCGQGGEWIPIRPGTDGALCAALAYEIINNGWADEEFLHTYCVGYDEETMPEVRRVRTSRSRTTFWYRLRYDAEDARVGCAYHPHPRRQDQGTG